MGRHNARIVETTVDPTLLSVVPIGAWMLPLSTSAANTPRLEFRVQEVVTLSVILNAATTRRGVATPEECNLVVEQRLKASSPCRRVARPRCDVGVFPVFECQLIGGRERARVGNEVEGWAAAVARDRRLVLEPGGRYSCV